MSNLTDPMLSRLRTAGLARILDRLESQTATSEAEGEGGELRAELDGLLSLRGGDVDRGAAPVALGSPIEFALTIGGELFRHLGRALDAVAAASSSEAARLALLEEYIELRNWLAVAAAWPARERASFILWLAGSRGREPGGQGGE